MSLQEFIPSSWSAIWTNVVTVAFENGLDRVASDGLNSQFAKFSEDPAISPAIVLFQFQDQLLDLFCGSRPATLFSERRLFRCRLSNPAWNRSWVDDRRDFVQRRSEPDARIVRTLDRNRSSAFLIIHFFAFVPSLFVFQVHFFCCEVDWQKAVAYLVRIIF